MVPGLFGPLRDRARRAAVAEALLSGVSLADTERWLSRARLRATGIAGEGIEPLLAAVFGLGMPLPSAALTRQLDAADAGTEVHLRADPVHLQAGLEQATLLHGSGPGPGLRITAGESEALAAAVNEALADDGLRVEPLTATRWYLRLPAMPAADFSSPYALNGASLRDSLPTGAEGSRWRRLLTVTQTALYASPVNEAREARGEPPVNSLWFFGAGSLPARSKPSLTVLSSTHELALALAAHTGVPAAAPPADGAAWLTGLSRGTHALLFEECSAATCAADAGGWCLALEALQTRWLVPLARALADGSLASLTVMPDAPHAFVLTRGSSRAFWRRQRPLHRLAAVLD